MALFSGNGIVDKLKQRSEAALSMFRKTIVELEDINEEIGTEVEFKETQITSLQKAVHSLNEQAGDNDKIIKNIKKILEE